jgi:hypothetical protein
MQVERVVLRAPVLRASFRSGKLAAGSLDPLIREFLARAAEAQREEATDHIERGLLLLDTEYGAVRIAANARVDDGKLQSLAATSAPAALHGAAFDATVGAGTLSETTANGRIAATFAAPLTKLTAQGVSISGGRVVVRFASAYPDPTKARGLGPSPCGRRHAAEAGAPGGRLGAGRSPPRSSASGRLGRRPCGARPRDRRPGRRQRAAGAARVGRLRAVLATDDVVWTRKGGDRLSATVRAERDRGGPDGRRPVAADLTVALGGPVT